MEKISEWTCPLCTENLILEEFKSKRGFLLTCKGTDAIPHRLRIYLENFRIDAPFLPSKKVPDSKKSRVLSMLGRVRGVEEGETQSA